MYLIAGASGNTGKIIAHTLLDAGKKVRVLARNADKLAEFKDKGAEVMAADMTNPGEMKAAFQGVKAAYMLIPPNYTAPNFRAYQNVIVDAVVSAIDPSVTTHVVTLSSIGAHLPAGAGVVQGLADMELKLNAVPGLHVRNLRPCFFMENLLGSAGSAKQMGAIATPFRSDMKLPYVASKDIAAVASRRLMNLDFTGSGHEYILGQRDLSYDEIASILGNAVGKPDLQYRQIGYEDGKNLFIQMIGLSESVAEAFIEFAKSTNEEKVTSDYVRDASNTTQTSLEEFAPIFAHVYNSM